MKRRLPPAAAAVVVVTSLAVATFVIAPFFFAEESDAAQRARLLEHDTSASGLELAGSADPGMTLDGVDARVTVDPAEVAAWKTQNPAAPATPAAAQTSTTQHPATATPALPAGTQQPPPPSATPETRTQQGDAPPSATPPQSGGAEGERRGGAERGRGRGGAEGGDDEKKEEEKKPRKGIPVTEPLILQKCAGCHFDVGEKKLSRISFLRKTPEGWELSVKRMERLQNVKFTEEEAKQIVRYLANDHGLARAEADKAMYEIERRVHWSEAEADKDLRSTCGECHTLGRVLSERRDAEEWKHLKATHLAFFPLAQFQAFAGDGGGFDGVNWEAMTEAEADAEWERRRSERRTDRADKVLDQLAKDLPLFTPEWERWQVNRRSVPLAGTWELEGHEIGRGDVRGALTLTAIGGDEYETEWELSVHGEPVFVRKGKGLLYAGYQWRGKSMTKLPGEPPELREALLLADDWNSMRGRIFTGEYNELGMDVVLVRRTDVPEITSVDEGALMLPSNGTTLDVRGRGFPRNLEAQDFHAGEGVTITAAERVDERHVRITVDVARKAQRGKRELSFRAIRGPEAIVLYDTIDYVKVSPELGVARVGGKMRPPQHERFEALAMNRGPDDELYTADDYTVKVVPATWTIEEFPVRENDDDARYVGTLDARSGLFTPALDGPNTARRWSANNIGEVYVVATCRLNVRELPPKPKKADKKEKKEGEKPEEPKEDDSPIVIVEKEFRSRGRLLVMIPLYVNWNRYVWEQR